MTWLIRGEFDLTIVHSKATLTQNRHHFHTGLPLEIRQYRLLSVSFKIDLFLTIDMI